MLHAQAAPARISQRDTVYRLQHTETGLYVRLNCAPHRAAEPLRIRPRLAPAKLSTWFTRRSDAELVCSAFFQGAPLEVVRSDA